MEEEMEELYVEGVATHGGPESCAVVCEGGGESIDRGTRRPGYRATKCAFRGAHAVGKAEGNIGGGVIARRCRTPRGQRTRACTEPSCARTGRSRAPIRVISGRD